MNSIGGYLMAEAANDFLDVTNGEMAIWMLCFPSPNVELWFQCTESIFADGDGKKVG